jgi:cation:H+ antiporter
MLISFVILAVGILLLYYGSCWLVNGSSELALSFSIRPAVVGLTVVALATSAPELLVSIVAAVSGSSGVSVGNILGSNVINIALVLGLSALVKPVEIDSKLVKRELPYMCGATILFWIVCMDGYLGRIDGMILIAMLVIFLIYNVLTAKDNNSQNLTVPSKKTHLKNSLLVVVGLVSIALGADWVVDSSIFFARKFNFSEVFIGISIVAIGTSLPELATSVVAAVKKQSDISVGNIVGSNLFNICLVMGAVGLINPINISTGLSAFEFPAMVFVTLLLFLFAAVSHRIGRRYGLIFIACFFIYNTTAYILAR